MTNSVGTLIDTALEMAAPFGQASIPQKALIRHLGLLDRKLAGKIAREAPGLLEAQATSVSITSVGNTGGYTLTSAALAYKDFVYEHSEDWFVPIRIVPDRERHNPPYNPAAVVFGGKLFPCDPTGRNWQVTNPGTMWWRSGDSFGFKYIGLPTQPTGRASVLASPDMAEQYFLGVIYRLALQLGRAPQDMIQTALMMEEDLRRELGLAIMKYVPTKASFGADILNAGETY